MELPYVEDAVVEIVPDDERGDAFSAMLVLRAGCGDVDAGRVKSDLRGTLASLAVPRVRIGSEG